MHICWKTRVGPHGGPWVFLANSFDEGTWGCEKIRGGGSCFIAFLCGSFSKIFIGGTRGAPLPPPPCVHLKYKISVFSKSRLDKQVNPSLIMFTIAFSKSSTNRYRSSSDQHYISETFLPKKIFGRLIT